MHFGPYQVLRLLALALALHTFPFTLHTSAQRPPAQPNAAEILHKMQKLNVLGSVLYIVAHPDDENTRLITWLANGKKVRTGNLSLTRGDGGQNLIGPELGDALGIIRTQELMEARRIDGGEQFFTRAVDFGFSKNAAESFEKWGKQEVLSDVVRVIRTFRPDVIITRFAPDRSAGHGHHEASAILAHEAFDLAGDPKAFPEQLKEGLEVWQPRRLFFNGSSWWRRDLAEHAKNDPDWFTVDVGGYDPLLGLSYTEIAGRSRSMHKSQGFGAAETRGEALEYLHLEKGDRPKGDDIFEGIDMTWGREKGAAGNIPDLLAEAILHYDLRDPSASIDVLTGYDRFSNYQAYMWRTMSDVAGLSLESSAQWPTIACGDSSWVDLSLTNRSNVVVEAIFSLWLAEEGVAFSTTYDTLLGTNKTATFRHPLVGGSTVDEPFWLRRSRKGDLYSLPLTSYIGDATELPVKHISHALLIHGKRVDLSRPMMHKWVDRVAGERIRPVYVTPVASVIPKVDNLIARGGPQTIEVEVVALTDSLTGQLNIALPEGWATTKDLKLVDIAKRNERQDFTFQLIPMEHAKAGAVKFEFVGPKGKADRTLHEIDYPHIMPQVYYTPAEVKLVPLDVKTTAKTVGYIKGAGDDVPQAIEQLGATVEFIDASATLESLRKYDAIVVGIRAYNNNPALKRLNPVLMRYVEEGGTLVAQYTTRTNDMMLPDSLIGPYPFQLTRGRVTVEEAPPTFLDPKHPLLNTPNKITAADFDGWVQERGLYFVGERDPRYTALIAWNDPGEEPLDGALIVCDHGKGRYVYTGISFFRQLPAGVAGAYRLWGNLISKRAVE